MRVASRVKSAVTGGPAARAWAGLSSWFRASRACSWVTVTGKAVRVSERDSDRMANLARIAGPQTRTRPFASRASHRKLQVEDGPAGPVRLSPSQSESESVRVRSLVHLHDSELAPQARELECEGASCRLGRARAQAG